MTVEPLSSAASYLQSVDIEVGFLRRGREIAETFSADEMAHNFVKAFSGIVLAVGEMLVFEFHGQNLKAIVKALSAVDLPDTSGGAPVSSSWGVVMERTDVTFIKASDSPIKIKSSAKK